MRFCEEKVCAISLAVDAKSTWLSTFEKFNQTLSLKYGTPVNSAGSVADDCRSEAQFQDCVMKLQLKLVREWRWPSGRILMKLGSGPETPRLDLIYVRQSAHTPVADAL